MPIFPPPLPQEQLGRLPGRQDLDIVAADYPIICWRRCWHILVCNSKALSLCGVTAASAERVEGVDLDPDTKQPTGILREKAADLLGPLLTKEDPFRDKVGALKTCLSQLPAVGLVGVLGRAMRLKKFRLKKLVDLFETHVSGTAMAHVRP